MGEQAINVNRRDTRDLETSPRWGAKIFVRLLPVLPVLATWDIRSKKCAHDDHPSDLILLIHITGKVFHKALYLFVIGTDIPGSQYRGRWSGVAGAVPLYQPLHIPTERHTLSYF
jgi:hypothetical protein